MNGGGSKAEMVGWNGDFDLNMHAMHPANMKISIRQFFGIPPSFSNVRD
jgi:hypothetical protein